MKFKKEYMVGISIGIFILIMDVLLFLKTKWFLPGLIIAVSIAWSQIWLDIFSENRRQKDLESRFLDFVRNLAGAIKSGMPVPKAITHISKLDYGPLSKYVRRLGYQVEWAIPVHKALIYFSNSTKNEILKRAVSTVIEAEQSGGNMEEVLESITGSLIEIKKIKESRRASVNSQTVQSYIIFFVFIGVMIVIQRLLVPYLLGTQTGSILGGVAEASSPAVAIDVTIDTNSFTGFIITATQWFTSLKGIFLMLSLIQGFFAGIIIGKLSEGEIISGLKHSLVLMTIAFFVMTVLA
ncbi:type II secretion system F family protein [Candidatus Woesearchaeota archaeon]|nr:type II secretion system F family protein [Candidatus Woesearchaeota archaeon]